MEEQSNYVELVIDIFTPLFLLVCLFPLSLGVDVSAFPLLGKEKQLGKMWVPHAADLSLRTRSWWLTRSRPNGGFVGQMWSLCSALWDDLLPYIAKLSVEREGDTTFTGEASLYPFNTRDLAWGSCSWNHQSILFQWI